MRIEEAETRMLAALDLIDPTDQLVVHIVSLRLGKISQPELLPTSRPYLYLTGLDGVEFPE